MENTGSTSRKHQGHIVAQPLHITIVADRTAANRATQKRPAMSQHNVLEYLERAALTRADVCAVSDEHARLTYRELLDEARSRGCALSALGAGAQPVMVFMEKSARTLATLLGTLYAGGFYVPVDPAAPDMRLASMYATLGTPLVVVGDTTRERARAALPDARLVEADDLTAQVDTALLERIRAHMLDCDPAYVLFTSGSTGAPKGVAVSHRAIIDFIDTFTATFGFTCDDVFANQAPFDFDVSVKDIYSALATGGELAIVPRRLFSQPAALVEYVDACHATVMTWAVAALCLVSSLHALDGQGLPHVRRVLFSGEVMPLKHLAIWMEHLPQAQFVNLYGPTEITCNCTYHEVERGRIYDKSLPLGRPFANRQVMLLDGDDRLVTQPGIQGEICVCGASVALGYYAAREQTERAFVRNPLQQAFPQVMYRTGDMGTYDSNGDLFFCGRKDNQIKHMGHRIELEEIDAAFERCGGVTRCRCSFDPEKSRIHAFYEGDADSSELLARIHEELPVFMHPASLEHVDEMPLTKNGKVDRRAMLDAYLAEQQRLKELRRQARAQRKKEVNA